MSVTYRPMLAHDAPIAPPVGTGFDFEIKFDGFRCGLIIGAGAAKLVSRQGTVITGWFPELAGLQHQVAAKNALIDGEIISGDGSIETFNHLLRRARLRGKTPKESLSITFVAFDILWQDDVDCTSRPLEDRRSSLRSVVTENKQVAVSRIFTDGRALLAIAASHGLEGIIAKRIGSLYEAGVRSRSWLKTKVPGAHLAHETLRRTDSRVLKTPPMQLAPPPPGPTMQFDEWCSAIVSGVRALLPEAKAARKGRRLVLIRVGDRTARLEHSGSAFWIQFAAESSKTTMSSMYDERRDTFTTANFSRSIAGFFDARFTR